MDLEPFARINPCGYAGLPVTQLRDVDPVAADPGRVGVQLAARLAGLLHQVLVDTG
jgi:lipoyl(octanoyl) transferase